MWWQHERNISRGVPLQGYPHNKVLWTDASKWGWGAHLGTHQVAGFYFLGRGHFKYLYLCGGTPKIIKILVVVPKIIDGVPTPPQVFFPGKDLGNILHKSIKKKQYQIRWKIQKLLN